MRKAVFDAFMVWAENTDSKIDEIGLNSDEVEKVAHQATNDWVSIYSFQSFPTLTGPLSNSITDHVFDESWDIMATILDKMLAEKEEAEYRSEGVSPKI